MTCSLNELPLNCNNSIKIIFNRGKLSYDAGLLLIKEFTHKIEILHFLKDPSKPMISITSV